MDRHPPDIVEQTGVVEEAEEQGLDLFAAGFPVEAGEHRIDALPQLEFEHRALSRQIGKRQALGDDAVEAGHVGQPAAGLGGCRGRLAHRQRRVRSDPRDEGFERRTARGERLGEIGAVASPSRSKAMSFAGSAAASMATRLAAGCSLSCSASKDWPGMTISPSSTKSEAGSSASA